MRDARALLLALLLATPFACSRDERGAKNGIAQPLPSPGSGGTIGTGGTEPGAGTGGIGPGAGSGGISTGGSIVN
jgi:hypothetical protein